MAVSGADRVRRGAPAAEEHRTRALALLPELADRPVPHRRAHHRLAAVLAGVLSVALVGAIFAGFWGYLWWQREVGPQQTVEVSSLAGDDLAVFRASAAAAAAAPPGTGTAPVVLTYHDIAPRGSSDYVVSPGQFAAQMAMLDEAGYHSLTAAEFLRYQRTGEVAPRSVLITFDDGTRGLWTYADAVLQRHGFTAVAFLITGSVGEHEPYYLTWPQIDRMAASGRWSFGSHTDALHTRVRSSEGSRVPALITRPAGESGPGSLDEFRSDVRTDLQRSLREFSEHGLPRPQLFAWPFSGIAGRQPDPAAAAAAEEEVGRLFRVAFVNVFRPRPATPDDVRSGRVQRLEVDSGDTARGVFERMQDMVTLPVGDLRPVADDPTWLEPGGHPAPLDEDRRTTGVVVPEARSVTYLRAHWAPQRTSEWRRYRLTGTLHPAAGGGIVGVLLRVGDRRSEVTVQLSAREAVVRKGSRTVASRVFSDTGDVRPAHTVDVVVDSDVTRVSLDGKPLAEVQVADGSRARGGIGVVFGRDDPQDRWGRIRDLRVQPVR